MKKLPLSMRCFAHCIQGQRLHMEDYYSIAYQKKFCSHNDNQTSQHDIDLGPKIVHKKHVDYVYFGIFDGHGGKNAAEFARANLLEYIVRQDDFWKSDDQSILNAIKKGFVDTHMAMLDHLPRWPKTIRNLPSTSGTTASVLFIKNGKYYTGHVGDSRIVVGSENTETKNWIAHSMTTDHKPESPEEKKRIEEAGGEVHNKSGVHRVVWQKPILRLNYDLHESLIPKVYPVHEDAVQTYACIPFLAVARSLGDLWSISNTTGKYVVSPEPDVAVQSMSPNDKTIILASDGLWNMVSSADAVRIIQELTQQENQYMLEDYYIPDEDDIAKSLVYYAYQQWTSRNLRSDNTSAIVVLLDEIQKPTTPHSDDISMDACIDCFCNHVDHDDSKVNLEKDPFIQLGDRFRFQGSFDLIGFRTEHPNFSYPSEPREYFEEESMLRSMMSIPPSDSDLSPPLSHTMLSSGETRILHLPDGNIVTIISLTNTPPSNSKERSEFALRRSLTKNKLIKNAYTQANRKQISSNTTPQQSACNHETGLPCVEILNSGSYAKKPVIPDVWPISSENSARMYDEDIVSSKKENAIITEIQKVVQRVSPNEVGSIKRKYDSATFDSIPCAVDKIKSPVKKTSDINSLRYDMRRRMLESSNGDNLNRSTPSLQVRPRKRIRVGSTSPTSKYSPPRRLLRSHPNLRRSTIQTLPQSSKQQKQSVKSHPKASILNRSTKVTSRLRPRHRSSRRSC